MKYLRVVLAVNDEDLPLVDGILEWLIESGQVDGNFPRVGIEGAYVSAPYDTREEALHSNRFPQRSVKYWASDEGQQHSEKSIEAVQEWENGLIKYYKRTL